MNKKLWRAAEAGANDSGEEQKVAVDELDKILDHDLWWDAETCLNYKLIDKII